VRVKAARPRCHVPGRPAGLARTAELRVELIEPDHAPSGRLAFGPVGEREPAAGLPVCYGAVTRTATTSAELAALVDCEKNARKSFPIAVRPW
jgi:hypothetical protein